MVTLYINPDNGDRAGVWCIGFWLHSDLVDSILRLHHESQILSTQAYLQPEICRWSEDNLFLTMSRRSSVWTKIPQQEHLSLFDALRSELLYVVITLLYTISSIYLWNLFCPTWLKKKKRWSCGCPHSDSCPFKVEFRMNQHVSTKKVHFAFLCML